jgi:hypothetical protein
VTVAREPWRHLRWVQSEAKRLKCSVSAVVADGLAQKKVLRAQLQCLKRAGSVDETELRRIMRALG